MLALSALTSLAPPLAEMAMNGRRCLAASSKARATFSPAIVPMLPPRNPNSETARTAE